METLKNTMILINRIMISIIFCQYVFHKEIIINSNRIIKFIHVSYYKKKYFCEIFPPTLIQLIVSIAL